MPAVPPADRILGYQEIAAITGKSHRTIRRMFQRGHLRRVQLGGVVGCWESELVAKLGWQGTGSLVTDDPIEPYLEGDDTLDDLADDVDADLA